MVDARRLTTRVVAGALAASLVCFAASLALALRSPYPAGGAPTLAPSALPEALAAGRPEAAATLGALLLLLAPLARLLGLAAQHRAAGDRRAVASALAALALLGLSFAVPGLAGPRRGLADGAPVTSR